MDNNISLFGYQGSAVDCAAYDMMVMKDMGILDADRRPSELNANLGANQYGGNEPVRMGWF